MKKLLFLIKNIPDELEFLNIEESTQQNNDSRDNNIREIEINEKNNIINIINTKIEQNKMIFGELR